MEAARAKKRARMSDDVEPEDMGYQARGCEVLDPLGHFMSYQYQPRLKYC